MPVPVAGAQRFFLPTNVPTVRDSARAFQKLTQKGAFVTQERTDDPLGVIDLSEVVSTLADRYAALFGTVHALIFVLEQNGTVTRESVEDAAQSLTHSLERRADDLRALEGIEARLRQIRARTA